MQRATGSEGSVTPPPPSSAVPTVSRARGLGVLTEEAQEPLDVPTDMGAVVKDGGEDALGLGEAVDGLHQGVEAPLSSDLSERRFVA